MKDLRQRSEIRGRSGVRSFFALPTLLALIQPGWSADFAALCADRTIIEHVYHAHRLNTSRSFEETMPVSLLVQLVRADLRKAAVLKSVYGVEITPAMVEAEVQRINTTSRAPEMLAKVKVALGNDPARFAHAFARPLVVERMLRSRFENDDILHAPQRARAEQSRLGLLAARDPSAAATLLREVRDGQVAEATWQLAPRPAADAPAAPAAAPPPTKGSARGGAYSVEATAQLAQVLNSPAKDNKKKTYFEDLDPELQKVLRVQLQRPGDVSAVIEAAGGFLIFVAREITPEALSVISLTIAKRRYEEWLEQQPEGQK